jgi:2-phosphoglycerate kinase
MNATTLRVILIGGPSNVGKSTLAQALASRLGWECISTDSLARHPGRPWGHVKPHVAEHYLSLSPDELIEDVLRHYAAMWPGVRGMIEARAMDPSAARVAFEGSALWPESVAQLHVGDVAALWLTASDDVLRARIHQASGLKRAAGQERAMVEEFVARTQRYNERMMRIVRRLGCHGWTWSRRPQSRIWRTARCASCTGAESADQVNTTRSRPAPGP